LIYLPASFADIKIISKPLNRFIMKKKTYYHIILDQSGSMQDCIHSTVSGFNEQLQVIKSLQERYPEQEIRVGLTRFNEKVMHTYFSQLPDKIAELSVEIYQPNGSTALYDAIGMTTRKVNEDIGTELISDIATAVVVIITDGYENSSRQFDLAQIKSMIRELEATGKWTFSYLGATLDAVRIAANLNIQHQNSISFDKCSMLDTFNTLGESMDNYLKEKREGKNPNKFLKP
jgi:hypothetical protein